MRRYHAPSPLRVRRLLWALCLGAVLAGCSGEAPLPGDPLRIATSALPDPVLGEAYREPVVAVGGLRPYELRLGEGSLPPGLTLQGGLLLGTPTRLGDYSFVIAVSDGTLASTFERFDVRVVDVPVPRLSIEVPRTEVRDDVTLRARVDDARRLRAVRVRLRWDDPSVRPNEAAVRTAVRDVALFSRTSENTVAVDLAFLGNPFDGGTELFRIDLSIEEATRLGLDLEVELLYADRHTYASERLGAPRTDGDAPDPAEAPDPDEANPDSDAAGGG